MTPPAVRHAVDAAFREEWGRVVATLIRRTGDWDLAEECAQEAFAEALRRWPVDGVPQRPGAWLTTVAGNRALDRLRRAHRGAELLEQVGRDPTGVARATVDSHKLDIDEDGAIEDDRLRLIFTCCHPALSLEGRVALTLRSLAGLTTAEIAHAFLVPEATMAKRLNRTKAKIAAAGIPYRVPPVQLLPERTGGVLAALYLLCHAEAPSTAATDWPQIAALYELLLKRTRSPVVALNRAVAVAMAEDLDSGLALVEELAGQGTLTDYHLLEATRADLHRRRGDRTAAIAAYRRALAAARTEPERRFILRRLAEQQEDAG
jgi:RNA polymerase sigma factor (sigma-70 family)